MWWNVEALYTALYEFECVALKSVQRSRNWERIVLAPASYQYYYYRWLEGILKQLSANDGKAELKLM